MAEKLLPILFKSKHEHLALDKIAPNKCAMVRSFMDACENDFLALEKIFPQLKVIFYPFPKQI